MKNFLGLGTVLNRDQQKQLLGGVAIGGGGGAGEAKCGTGGCKANADCNTKGASGCKCDKIDKDSGYGQCAES